MDRNTRREREAHQPLQKSGEPKGQARSLEVSEDIENNDAPEEIRTPNLLIHSQNAGNSEVIDLSDFLGVQRRTYQATFAPYAAFCCT